MGGEFTANPPKWDQTPLVLTTTAAGETMDGTARTRARHPFHRPACLLHLLGGFSLSSLGAFSTLWVDSVA